MTEKRKWAALTALLFCSCHQPPQTTRMTHDAYVWQRHWDESLLTAIQEAAPSIRAWRVLVGEIDGHGELTKVSVDWESLRRTRKPLIGVLRMKSLAVDKMSFALPVSGVEIDYDCATSQLAGYRAFLHTLRGKLGPATTLSITALPSWLESSELSGVLAEVDESVLQVHSVMNSKKGLFDRSIAYDWARKWATVSPKPFRVALPTYWSKVSWNEDGRVVAIESEVNRYGNGSGESRELFVEPGDVSALVADLQRAPLRNLVGIAWFRLPTSEDQRAWNPTTWRAVMKGLALNRTAPVARIKETQTGVRDLYLQNVTANDERLPAQILVSSEGCEYADAMEPYQVQRELAQVRFQLGSGSGVLRAGQERMVGWVRCSGKELGTHVSVQ